MIHTLSQLYIYPRTICFLCTADEIQRGLCINLRLYALSIYITLISPLYMLAGREKWRAVYENGEECPVFG